MDKSMLGDLDALPEEDKLRMSSMIEQLQIRDRMLMWEDGLCRSRAVDGEQDPGVDIQLGLAIDSTKATLAAKRRLACEMVKYWQQAQDNLMNLPLANGWGEKHLLFVKWKYIEAKAAAYYYHGLILDEGNTEKSHGMAVAALQAADEYLKESKKASEAFHQSVPLSRNPPLWGTMKFLSEKIPKDTSSKVRINKDLYSHEKIMETAPTLPDFALALKPDEYQLPQVHVSWNEETTKMVHISSLKSRG